MNLTRKDFLLKTGKYVAIGTGGSILLKGAKVFASPNGDIYISDEAPDAVVGPDMQNLPNKDWGWGNRYHAELTDPDEEPQTQITSLPEAVEADAINKKIADQTYKVYTVYRTGNVEGSSNVQLDFQAIPVGVDEHELKPAFGEITNSPNPFTYSTKLEYSLMDNHPVKISVHDLKGGLVSKIFEGSQSKGNHEISWDGTNGYGSPVSPGLYLMNIMVPGLQQKTLKVIKQ